MHILYYEFCTRKARFTILYFYYFKRELIHAVVNYLRVRHENRLLMTSGLVFSSSGDTMTPKRFATFYDSSFVTTTTAWKVVRARNNNKKSDIFADAVVAAIDFKMDGVMPIKKQSAKWYISSMKAIFVMLRLPMSLSS